MQYFSAATENDTTCYKAWHSWASMNFETVLYYKHRATDKLNSAHITQFTVPAVDGFFRSIALSRDSSLQDTLRLLTLWFDYGQWPEVYDAIVEGIRTVDIDTWLQVRPLFFCNFRYFICETFIL